MLNSLFICKYSLQLFNVSISISLGTESKYTFLVYAEDNTFPFVDRYGIQVWKMC